jgi:hypothetical protein
MLCANLSMRSCRIPLTELPPVPLAVAWHRFDLINEQPHDRYLRIDGNVLLYAG